MYNKYPPVRLEHQGSTPEVRRTWRIVLTAMLRVSQSKGWATTLSMRLKIRLFSLEQNREGILEVAPAGQQGAGWGPLLEELASNAN